jgi:ParB-like chromosome segregation protein Spo0J
VTKAKRASARDEDPLLKTSTGLSDSTATSAEQLQFHPLADLIPPMRDEEFAALVNNIKQNGLQEEIVLHEGMILDGRHRYRACLAAGWDEATIRLPLHVRHFCPEVDGDPAAYVISKNIHRRHLTAEQKRDALVKLVAAQPEKSDRELAKQAKVSHPTIAKARREAEATGKALPVDKRLGSDGKARKQPAKRKATVDPRKAAAKAREDRAEMRAFLAEYEAEAEQLAVDLIKVDRNLARRVYEHLGEGICLGDALAGKLDGSDPGPIPEFLIRAPKAVA